MCLQTSQEIKTVKHNLCLFVLLKSLMGDMFRPDLGHLQALVKIQILRNNS